LANANPLVGFGWDYWNVYFRVMAPTMFQRLLLSMPGLVALPLSN